MSHDIYRNIDTTRQRPGGVVCACARQSTIQSFPFSVLFLHLVLRGTTQSILKSVFPSLPLNLKISIRGVKFPPEKFHFPPLSNKSRKWFFFSLFSCTCMFWPLCSACDTTCAYKHTFMLIRKYCAYKLRCSTRVHWTICVHGLTCSNACHWLLRVQWTTNMLYVQQPSSCQIYCCTCGTVCKVVQAILLLGLASPECAKYNAFSISCGEKLSFN